MRATDRKRADLAAKLEHARKMSAQAEQHRDNEKVLAEVRRVHHEMQQAYFERFKAGCPLDTASANLLHAGAAASGSGGSDPDVHMENWLEAQMFTRMLTSRRANCATSSKSGKDSSVRGELDEQTAKGRKLYRAEVEGATDVASFQSSKRHS